MKNYLRSTPLNNPSSEFLIEAVLFRYTSSARSIIRTERERERGGEERERVLASVGKFANLMQQNVRAKNGRDKGECTYDVS